MLCKKCHKKTRVTDSRPKDDTIFRWRRCQNKKCEQYNKTFKTREDLVPTNIPAKPKVLPEAPQQRRATPKVKVHKHPKPTWEDNIDNLTDEELEALINGEL